MNSLDLGNTIFEGGGAILTWLNVRRLVRDREVKGVDWRVTAFWSAWGLWNLFYYPALGQWMSAACGVLLVAGNITWCGLVLHYRRKREQRRAKARALFGRLDPQNLAAVKAVHEAYPMVVLRTQPIVPPPIGSEAELAWRRRQADRTP